MSVGLPDLPEALPTRADLQAQLDEITADESTIKTTIGIETALKLIEETKRKSPDTVRRVIDEIGLSRHGMQRIFQLEDDLRSLTGDVADTTSETTEPAVEKKRTTAAHTVKKPSPAPRTAAKPTEPETDEERRLRLMKERHDSLGISHLGLLITDIDIESLPPHMRPGAPKTNGISPKQSDTNGGGHVNRIISALSEPPPAPPAKQKSSRRIPSQRAKLAAEEARQDRTRETLDEVRANLDRRASDLATRKAALDAREAELVNRERSVEERAAELAEEARRLEELQAALNNPTAVEETLVADLGVSEPTAVEPDDIDDDATTIADDTPTVLETEEDMEEAEPDVATTTQAEMKTADDDEDDLDDAARVTIEAEPAPPIVSRPRSPETMVRRKRPVYIPATVPPALTERLTERHDDPVLADLPVISLDVLTVLPPQQLLNFLDEIADVEHAGHSNLAKIAEQTGVPIWLIRDLQGNYDNIEYARDHGISIWRPGELTFTSAFLNRGKKPTPAAAPKPMFIAEKPKKKKRKKKRDQTAEKKPKKTDDHVKDFEKLVPAWERGKGSLIELSAAKRRQEKEAELTAACNNGLTLSQNRYGWKTVQPHLNDPEALANVLEDNGWTEADVSVWQRIFPTDKPVDETELPAYQHNSQATDQAWQQFEQFSAQYRLGDMSTPDEDDTDRRLNELEAAADHDVAAVLRTAVEHSGKAVQHLLAEHEYEKARKRKGKGPATVFDAIQRYGHDEDYKPRIADESNFVPTTAAPGSEQKLAELLKRVEAGEPLWHPADKFDFGGATDVRPRYD